MTATVIQSHTEDIVYGPNLIPRPLPSIPHVAFNTAQIHVSYFIVKWILWFS